MKYKTMKTGLAITLGAALVVASSAATLDDVKYTRTLRNRTKKLNRGSRSKPKLKPIDDKKNETEVLELFTTCPPKYDHDKSSYVAGDIIEVESEIYVCQSGVYENYCNLYHPDKDWTDEETDLWENAWLNLGKCSKAPKAPKGRSEGGEEEDEDDEEDSQPLCPAPYDWEKTTYVVGDLIEVKSNIFVCRKEKGYVKYCNMADKPKGDEVAERMWHGAWIHIGPCTLEETLEEVMEEEVLEEEARVEENVIEKDDEKEGAVMMEEEGEDVEEGS